MKSLAQIVKERATELEGKWVVLVPVEYVPYEDGDSWAYHLTGYEILCGVQASPECVADEKHLTRGRIIYHLIVADEEFVVRWYEHPDAPINIKVIKARQVSRGELGRYPDVPMPHFTRGAKGWRWVRLTTLARFLRLPTKKVWDDYYEIGRDVINGPAMKVCVDRCGKGSLVVRVNCDREGDMAEFFAEELYEHRRIWVPAGWASDVCYLVHFGRLNERRIARLTQTRSRKTSP